MARKSIELAAMVIHWQDELKRLERHRAKLTARDYEIPPITFSLIVALKDRGHGREARKGNISKNSGSTFTNATACLLRGSPFAPHFAFAQCVDIGVKLC